MHLQLLLLLFCAFVFSVQNDNAKDIAILQQVHDLPIPTSEHNESIAEGRRLIESTALINGAFGSSNGCARWGEPNVPPLGDCEDALSIMGFDPQIRSFVVGEWYANCTAHVCLPWQKQIRHCQVSLDFRDDVPTQDQYDTSEWMTLRAWGLWEIWKCATFRWIGPTGGGFKTGGYIDVGDLKKMRISIDFVDAGDDGGVVVV